MSVAVKRQKLVAEQEMLKRTLAMVCEETHEDFVAKLSPLEEEKLRLIAKAETMATHLVSSTDVIFAYESEEAEKEYELSCSKLKQDMLEEIRLEMERVKEQKKSGFGSASYNKAALALQRQSNMRKTRSSKKPNGAYNGFGLADEWSRPAPKRLSTVFTPLHKTLSSSEISRDLQLLEEFERDQDIATRNMATLPEYTSIFARYVRGKVLYKDMVLQEDDHIRVTKFLPEPEGTIMYKAIICDLTSAEVFVLKENGKYTRLLVQDLRNGSVVLEYVDGDEEE